MEEEDDEEEEEQVQTRAFIFLHFAYLLPTLIGCIGTRYIVTRFFVNKYLLPAYQNQSVEYVLGTLQLDSLLISTCYLLTYIDRLHGY